MDGRIDGGDKLHDIEKKDRDDIGNILVADRFGSEKDRDCPPESVTVYQQQ
jgi:hypothetical protein